MTPIEAAFEDGVKVGNRVAEENFQCEAESRCEDLEIICGGLLDFIENELPGVEERSNVVAMMMREARLALGRIPTTKLYPEVREHYQKVYAARRPAP
jgi:hypothetical protein